MTYFLLRARAIFDRAKYLTLWVILYIVCEYKMVTLNGGRGAWWQFGIFYVIDVFFFYFNCYYIYPIAYQQRRTIYKPLLIIPLTLGAHYFLSLIARGIVLGGNKGLISSITQPDLVNYTWRVLLVAVLAAVPFGFFTFIRMLKREKILENSVLYSRISPHLLFNALNFVHADVRRVSAHSGKMITFLSEYARYAMEELAEDGKANLKAELAQLDILIRMNELRFDAIYLEVKVHLEGPIEGYRIPPHSILSLAENIFKYGLINDPNKPARIEIFDSPRLLHILMHNRKAKDSEAVSNHLGLESLRKRLRNIYNNLFSMKIDETEEDFSIKLVIPI